MTNISNQIIVMFPAEKTQLGESFSKIKDQKFKEIFETLKDLTIYDLKRYFLLHEIDVITGNTEKKLATGETEIERFRVEIKGKPLSESEKKILNNRILNILNFVALNNATKTKYDGRHTTQSRLHKMTTNELMKIKINRTDLNLKNYDDVINYLLRFYYQTK